MNFECEICGNNTKEYKNKKDINNEEDKRHIFSFVYIHIECHITTSMFDDEEKIHMIYQRIISHCSRKLNCGILSKKYLIQLYRSYSNEFPYNPCLERLIFQSTNGETCISCPSRALNSCAYQCAFCPSSFKEDKNDQKEKELKIAKSYNEGQTVFTHLLDNKNNFVKYLLQHLIRQHKNGVSIDKLAMRDLGGTFHSYPESYRYEYSRDIYYCANVINDILTNHELLKIAYDSVKGEFDPDNKIMTSLRKPYQTIEEKGGKEEKEDIEDMFSKKASSSLKLSLKMEQDANTVAVHKIVSYSIETRPDQISTQSMTELLQLGVTIVELGLQSPNDEILRIVKRGHTRDTSIKAIKMLKNNGFHVHGQWMFDLPGSSKELDRQAIDDILSSDFRCDQIKIYPHLKMEGTQTKEWIDSGLYESWVEKDWDGFVDTMVYLVSNLDYTTRIVRIQRDLPQFSEKHPYGYTNYQPSNLEQIVTQKIYSNGLTREDIRFHEPNLRFPQMDKIIYYVNEEKRNGGKDIFISAESFQKNMRIMWGYCRVSIPESSHIKFLKTKKFGLIRELKVNGAVVPVGKQKNSGQHKGIGTKLLKIAEGLIYEEGLEYVTVTSAVGVRDYYRKKHNYELDSCGLMWKKIQPPQYPHSSVEKFFIYICVFFLFLYTFSLFITLYFM